MKNLALVLLCFCSIISNAQEDSIPQDSNKKNEITLNALTLVASGWIDVSYEYLINEESSFGVDLQFGFDENSDLTPIEIFLLPLITGFIFPIHMQRGFL